MSLKTSALLAVCVVCAIMDVDAQSSGQRDEWQDFVAKYSKWNY